MSALYSIYGSACKQLIGFFKFHLRIYLLREREGVPVELRGVSSYTWLRKRLDIYIPARGTGGAENSSWGTGGGALCSGRAVEEH